MSYYPVKAAAGAINFTFQSLGTQKFSDVTFMKNKNPFSHSFGLKIYNFSRSRNYKKMNVEQ